MSAAAVIVGVDAYERQPLTSAARDALTFRDTLVELGLVAEHEITLLTSPADSPDRLATSRNIQDALRRIYDGGPEVDQLYVYFSGHGLLAPVDAARGEYCTAFIPSDVRDISYDGNLLLNIDSLRERFRYAGPRDQFFFVDACRNLAYEENPGNVPPISWPESANPSGAARAQATLFAVSPKGRALGQRDGLGVMTTHLVEALRGHGLGTDWSDEVQGFVITMQSVRNHVRHRVRETVAGEPQWAQLYMLPELAVVDADLGPIRVLDEPPSAALTVSVEPESAAEATHVSLSMRRHELTAPCWPPSAFRERVTLEPQTYRVLATSTLGVARPDPEVIDLRLRSEVLVRVGLPSPAPAPRLSGPGFAQLHAMAPGAETAEPTGSVQAAAVEPQATIELERLEHPYLHWEREAFLTANVPPGRYRADFRMGDDTYSTTEFEIAEGDRVRVTPAAPPSALLTEAGVTAPDAETAVISEAIGPIQAEVLPTMLSLLGIKLFDAGGMITDQIPGAVPPLDPAYFGNQPVVTVIAVEGDHWAAPLESVVNGITCELHANGQPVGLLVPPLPLGPLGHGYGRIRLGVSPPPLAPFSVVINSPHFGRIEIAAASLPNRVTVVTCTLHPDGHVDVSQNLLRLPGHPYAELVPDIPYARMVRELQLAGKLFEGGRLTRYLDWPATELISQLLHAKWTDPVVGCMAYYAWADAGRAGLTGWHPDAAGKLQITADNLRTYFGQLPDVRVIAALSAEDQRHVLVDELLGGNEVPVLRRSVSELAQLARDRGAAQSPIVRLDARLPLAEGWALKVEPRASDVAIDHPARAEGR